MYATNPAMHPSPQAALFPRAATRAVATHQKSIRKEHAVTIDSTLRLAREIDGMNFGEIMSELSKRRVLILGRFMGRRLAVLKGIKAYLEKHPNRCSVRFPVATSTEQILA